MLLTLLIAGGINTNINDTIYLDENIISSIKAKLNITDLTITTGRLKCQNETYIPDIDKICFLDFQLGKYSSRVTTHRYNCTAYENDICISVKEKTNAEILERLKNKIKDKILSKINEKEYQTTLITKFDKGNITIEKK